MKAILFLKMFPLIFVLLSFEVLITNACLSNETMPNFNETCKTDSECKAMSVNFSCITTKKNESGCLCDASKKISYAWQEGNSVDPCVDLDTVKPVFNGHLMDRKKVANKERWPLVKGSISNNL